MTLLEGMRDLMDSTRKFRNYREALLESSPPCVPFIGKGFSSSTTSIF